MGRKRRAQGAPGSDDTVYQGQGDPLLWALFEGDADGARTLIESDHCNVEALDQLGWRPLHRASYAGLDGIVSLLLERRADPIAPDTEGVRPLHVAASRGHPECCRLLVSARADPTEPDRQTGMTPQIYAMSKEDEVARKLGEILGTVDLKLLAAWSNPLEMAKLISTSSTDEERAALEEKFIEDLDKPAGCNSCDDDAPPRIVRTYNWSKSVKNIVKKGSDGGCSERTPGRGLWRAAMQSLPELEDKLWIQEWDEPVLRYCRDVTKGFLDCDDVHKGFRLAFHFEENPYFSNGTLEKEYHTQRPQSDTGDIEVTEIKSIEIDWRAGKDVTVQRAEGGGRQGEGEPERGEEERPRFSFFRNFFCSLRRGGVLPTHFDEEGVRRATGVDDREKMLGMLLGVEYELGCSMRDQLVPFAARWRDGEAAADMAREPAAEGACDTPGGDID